METNHAAVESISDGNSVCKICISYLTLGRNDGTTRDNFYIHINGRKHIFCSTIFDKVNSGPLYLYENGISSVIDRCFNFYCSYCNCKLPELSKDRRLNILNINIHLRSKRHNFNLLLNLAQCINTENDNNEIFTSNNFEPTAKIPLVLTSVTAQVALNLSFSLEEIFSQLPDQFYGHKNIITYDGNCKKLICNSCDCFIARSKSKIILISNILCHLKGRKHLVLYESYINNDIKTSIAFDEVEDTNLNKVIKLAKNKIIDKNEKYICRNSSDNIVCKLCKCILPSNGISGYLSAIENFQLHFLGKKHKGLVKNEVKVKIIKTEHKQDDDVCDETILKIFNELLNHLPRENLCYFMISKWSNLVCKICSCAILRDIDLSSRKRLADAIETHLQTRKHLRNYSYKESVKNYDAVTKNIHMNPCTDNKNKNSSLCDLLKNIMKLDSCGQLVCATCQKIIVPKNCELQTAVTSHLKGKQHKFNNAKSLNKLSESILNDIIDSLPSNFQINKNVLSFVFNHSIVNCNICNYMFKVYNNYKLRNNVMIHIKSAKHKKLLDNYRVINGIDSDCNHNEINYCCNENEGIYYSSQLKGSDFISAVRELGDESFLDHIFENYIPDNLKFNKHMLSLKSNEFFCTLCNLTLMTPPKISAAVLVLINHLTEDLHWKKVKKNQRKEFYSTSSTTYPKKFTENSLNNMFKHNIPKNNAKNRRYIKIISKKLFCVVCQSDLLGTKHSNEEIIKNLKCHFQSNVHINNILKSEIVDKKISNELSTSEALVYKKDELIGDLYVSNLFNNFVVADLKFNAHYISYDANLKTVICELCNCMLSAAKDLKIGALHLTQHLKGTYHNDCLKKNSVVDKNCLLVGRSSSSTTNAGTEGDYSSDILKYIHHELKLNTEFFIKNAKEILCNVCNSIICDLSYSDKNIEKISYHFEECIYVDSVKKVNREVKLFLNNSLAIHKEFLYDIFFNHIPSSLQFNKEYITIEQEKFFCNICYCQIPCSKLLTAAAFNLAGHLKGSYHKINLEKSQTVGKYHRNNDINNTASRVTKTVCSLNDIFLNYIKRDLQFNREYIITKSNMMVCIICQRKMSMSSDPERTVKNLTSHLTGSVHKNALKALENVNESKKPSFNSVVVDCFERNEKFLDVVFKKFIQLDHQSNRKYITLNTNQFFCCLCNFDIVFSEIPETIAENVMDHLSGSCHQNGLNKSINTQKDVSVTNSTSTDDIISSSKSTSNEMLVCSKSCTADDIFCDFIPEEFHFNKEYIDIKCSTIICKLCNSQVSCVSLHETTQNLLSHLKGMIHQINLKKLHDVTEKITEPLNSSFNTSVKKSVNKSELYLNDVFENLSNHYQFNRHYVTIFEANKLVCNVCNCLLSKSAKPEVAAKNLLQHLKGEFHKCKLKKQYASYNMYETNSSNGDFGTSKSNKTFLDDVFKNYIRNDYKDERMFVSVVSNNIVCSICKCRLSKPVSPQAAAFTLMEHFKGYSHEYQFNLRKVYKTASAGVNEDCNSFQNGRSKEINVDSGISKNTSNTTTVGSVIDNTFLDNIFANVIPGDFQYNRKYIMIESGRIVCTLCKTSESKPESPQILKKWLLDHLQGKTDLNNSKEKNIKENAENNLGCTTSSDVSNNKLEEDQVYLDNLFADFIDSYFKPSRKFIIIESNYLVCNLCNSFVCPATSIYEMTARHLMSHLKGSFHEGNLKTKYTSKNVTENIPRSTNNFSEKDSLKLNIVDNSTNHKERFSFNTFETNETSLDDVFTQFLPLNLRDNRKYVVVQSNKFMCNICKCMFCKPFSPEATAKVLIEHFKGGFHRLNMKTGRTVNNDRINVNKSGYAENSDSLLDNLFTNFITHDYQFNRTYITCKKNSIVCRICNCSLSVSRNTQSTAQNLISHLKGNFHKSNLSNIITKNFTSTV